ncbi:MAG: UbiD family decarboxylase [Chloroflexi bacterium]|nr:UbiD family decarboxylase [Chloroflexota bacterium]
MAYYKDLREYIKALEENNHLVRITRKINKDTELMPLVRWQYRGLSEADRKAFLFENVTDAKGKKYDMPVLVAAYAGTKKIYALGLMCDPNEIMDKWTYARANPIEPKLVARGPVQEEIHMGDKLLEHGGLDEIPVPISDPGFDNAPYLSAPFWVSKDPETGVVNVGTYRAMLKSQTRLGILCLHPQHMRQQWQKCKEMGYSSLPAAVVLGATPNVAYCSVARLPFGVSEYGIAGGLAGAPVELVKCQTVDIEVPATAETVIEGEIPTDYLEREGPFGEHTGYTTGEYFSLYMNVKCITHRKNTIHAAFISQFPPSESSVLRGVAQDAAIYRLLRHDCNIPTVLDVHWHRESGSNQWCVIKMKKNNEAQPWQALYAASGYNPGIGKTIIVVDEDVDIYDPDSVIWAICYGVQPHRDTKVIPGKLPALDPSSAPMDKIMTEAAPGSALLINATRKWPYPSVALPAREFMERAKKIWEEEKLPKLTPKVPWHGYELGLWSEENREEAKLAVKGEHYQTGEKLTKNRLKV